MSTWRMLEGGDGTHRITFMIASDDQTGAYHTAPRLQPEDEDWVFGLEEQHRGPDGLSCGGYLAWRPWGYLAGSGHDLVNLEPLTITPAISCLRCASHGFIADGRWYDA